MYSGPPPLPPGWSQHLGPNGQPYYFNAASGQSTHAHPATFAAGSSASSYPPQGSSSAAASTSELKKPKKEKPKHKDPIPDAPGWIRVTTNLGNVFYTHPESKRSEWSLPEEIREAVEKMDQAQAEEEESAAPLKEGTRKDRSDESPPQSPVAPAIEDGDTTAQLIETEAVAPDGKRKRPDEGDAKGSDDEAGIDAAELIGDGDQDDSDDDQPDSKRLRADDDEEGEEDEDDDGEWQERMAADMAAEEADEEVEQEMPLRTSKPLVTLDKPPVPTAPPQPPLPQPNGFQSMAPPPGGYTGPPPGFVPPAPSPALSREESLALFKHMLSTLNGTPQEINPMAPWDAELPKFVHRSEYAALSALRDRQDAFNEWCRERLRQKREQRKNGGQASGSAYAACTTGTSGTTKASSSSETHNGTSAQEAFLALLAENVKSTRSRFDDFRKEFKKDRRFYGFGRDDKERERHFKNHLRELGEKKREAAAAAEERFRSLLDEIAGEVKRQDWATWNQLEDQVLKQDVWTRVKKMGSMEKRKEYDAVGSSSRRAEIFVQWAQSPSSAAGQRKYKVDHDAEPSEEMEQSSGKSGSHQQAEALSRQEQALRNRQDAVQRQRFETDLANRKALAHSNREEAGIQYSQLLVDRVRDPLTKFADVAQDLEQDPRWGGNNINDAHRMGLFREHIQVLLNKKRESLRKIFLRLAPTLDVEEETILPLVRHDSEYERLHLDDFVQAVQEINDLTEDGLPAEWKSWTRHRENEARVEFDIMLKENKFLDFWGRLRAEAQRRVANGEDDADGQAKKALELDVKNQTEEEEEEASRASLLEMAGQVDLDEIHSVLRGDQRYRAWKHRPKKREEWIRSYLEGLGGRKQTVFQ